MTAKLRLNALSGNTLKIIAAVCMLLDHLGIIFFPYNELLRIIGRLAFPLFAFFIAEGCKYTRSRTRYLLTMAGLGLVFQLVYFFVLDELYMCIFITFSISIILIYLLDKMKAVLFDANSTAADKATFVLLFIFSVLAAYLLNLVFEIDYGFEGCMTPVFASLFHSRPTSASLLKKLDRLPLSVAAMLPPLIMLSVYNAKWYQPFSFLALPLLLLYSGKRGRWKLKYFFYVFYPAHLVILYGIDWLLNKYPPA